MRIIPLAIAAAACALSPTAASAQRFDGGRGYGHADSRGHGGWQGDRGGYRVDRHRGYDRGGYDRGGIGYRGYYRPAPVILGVPYREVVEIERPLPVYEERPVYEETYVEPARERHVVVERHVYVHQVVEHRGVTVHRGVAAHPVRVAHRVRHHAAKAKCGCR